MWNNLHFFKGFDWDLNAELDENNIWQCSVYMERISVGLFDTVNLFILQSVINADTDEIHMNFPVSNTLDSNVITAKWQDEPTQSDDIFMYVVSTESGIAKVEKKNAQDIEVYDRSIVQNYPADLDALNEVNLDNSALQINISLMSEVEARHNRVLELFDPNGSLFAQISFYGETEAEDERLRTLLQNFGATLNESDFMLFKEHDISEMAPDQMLLNRKRKELLLELKNIQPFIGTYKAILNAIDFFGYNNLTLKEYWVNLDKKSRGFGKLKAIPVPNSSKIGDQIRKGMFVNTPSRTLKKTSKFSIVYKINMPDGGADEWDIPTVQETFDYTPEEVIIKLYGLKNKLQKEYMPLNARIIDIVGEADFFMQKNLNTWNNQQSIAVFNEGHKIKFKVFPEDRPLFIEDHALVLRPLYDQYWDSSALNPMDNPYHNLLDLNFSNYDTLDSTELEHLRSSYTSFYNNYYDQQLDTFNQNISVGCPIILNGKETLPDTWDDATFTWNDLVADSGITWNNWWKRYVYEIEWLISGPRGYSESFMGPVDDYIYFPVSLPYDGQYSVEMRTYDLYGHQSYDLKRDLIEVRLKELELYGIHKWLNVKQWSDISANWNDLGGYWDLPTFNENTVDESIATFYLSLDRANYLHTEAHSVNTSTVIRYFDEYSETGFSETPGPYQWDNCEFRWYDTQHLWWQGTKIAPDQAASFRISGINSGSEITISFRDPVSLQVISETFNFGISADITGIEKVFAAADYMNAQPENTLAAKFNWNPVALDLNNDGLITSPEDEGINAVAYLLAVGKSYSDNYDYIDVIGQNCTVSGKTHVEHNNPTYDDSIIFRDYAEVERSTHVTISCDITKMPGAKNPKWTLTNNRYPNAGDIYYDDMWLTYIFQKPGWWTIDLEVEDTNGNKNRVSRNMIKVK